jgi:hypothetical protein
MATDREILKNQQLGALVTTDASSPRTAIEDTHRHSRDFMKTGTENAATNVASTLMFTVKRKSKTRAVNYLTGTNVASNASNYVVITVQKQTAGASATTVATYNTAPSAQGAITTNIPAAFSVVTNTDGTLAADDTLHYIVEKYGTGQAVAIGTFTFDGEAV